MGFIGRGNYVILFIRIVILERGTPKLLPVFSRIVSSVKVAFIAPETMGAQPVRMLVPIIRTG